MLRTGLWRVVICERSVLVLTTGAIRFRQELRLFQRIRLETRIVGWDDTHFIIRQDMLVGIGPKVAATALVRAGLYDRRRRSFKLTKELLEIIGVAAPETVACAEAALMTDIFRLTRSLDQA